LNHDEKFAVLASLAAIFDLADPDKWDFQVTGAIPALLERQKIAPIHAELVEILRDFRIPLQVPRKV